MKNILIVLFLSCVQGVMAQVETQKWITDLNQKIDNAVVSKDIKTLKESYADDFVFTHGTGKVDSKESWIRDVETSTSKFVARVHDSTLVELHDNVAIITGSLSVSRLSPTGTKSDYGVRYVRVYVSRNKKWLLVSHRTVKEWHY